MDEAKARRLADAYLRTRPDAVHWHVVTAAARETRRSWIFALTGPQGEILVGGTPLVVSKRTEAVTSCRAAELEFPSTSQLSWSNRIWRRWHRWRTY